MRRPPSFRRPRCLRVSPVAAQSGAIARPRSRKAAHTHTDHTPRIPLPLSLVDSAEHWVPPPSRVGYLLSRWRGPATPPTYLPSEAVKIYMYGRLVA